MTSTSIFVGTALPDGAVKLLAEHGFLPRNDPRPAASAATAEPELPQTTPIQGQIVRALTRRRLNDQQVPVLEIYWRAYRSGEPALSVDEAGRRLAGALSIEHKLACDYVRGSLRSFGRRLLKTLKRPPVKFSHDAQGAGVADEIPLLAMMSVETGPIGESRHRLNEDGAVAVAAALGLNEHGIAADSILTGDPTLDDPDAVVLMGMDRSSAALLKRVQKSMGLSMDATIKALAALAGAG